MTATTTARRSLFQHLAAALSPPPRWQVLITIYAPEAPGGTVANLYTDTAARAHRRIDRLVTVLAEAGYWQTERADEDSRAISLYRPQSKTTVGIAAHRI